MPSNPYATVQALTGQLQALAAKVGQLGAVGNQLKVTDENGILRLVVGQLPDGTYGLVAFSDTGQRVLSTNDSGVAVYDDHGKERVQMGLLLDGDYGITFTDATGVSQNLLPFYSDYTDPYPELTTTSISPVVLSGSPAVTAWIPGGDFEITAGAFMTAASGTTATIILYIDGTEIAAILQSGATSSGTAIDSQSTRRWSQWAAALSLPTALTVGSHTFTLRYLSQSGGSVSFANNYLKVQPL